MSYNGSEGVMGGVGLTVSTSLFYGELCGALFAMRWMVLGVFLLVCADFVYGILDSVKKRGEAFRFSRAGRRTMGKLLEYLFYLAGGFVLGKAIFEPLGVCTPEVASSVAFALAALFEVDSIADHVCSLHGWRKFSVKRMVVGIIKRKFKSVTDVIEESGAKKK